MVLDLHRVVVLVQVEVQAEEAGVPAEWEAHARALARVGTVSVPLAGQECPIRLGHPATI